MRCSNFLLTSHSCFLLEKFAFLLWSVHVLVLTSNEMYMYLWVCMQPAKVCGEVMDFHGVGTCVYETELKLGKGACLFYCGCR